jgi:hypothetical protein
VHSVEQEMFFQEQKLCVVLHVCCVVPLSVDLYSFTLQDLMSVYNEGNIIQKETCFSSCMKYCHVFVLSRQVCLMLTIALWLKSDDGWIIEIRNAKSDECRRSYL